MRARILALVWLLVTLALLGFPVDALPEPSLIGVDMGAHLALFALGTVLALRGWPRHTTAVIVALLVLAPLAELWQWALPTGRQANAYDALANAAGVALGGWVYLRVRGARQRREA